MTYYLQSDGEQSMIDTHVHSGYELRAEPIDARSWIDEKKKFGFELTPLQKSIWEAQ